MSDSYEDSSSDEYSQESDSDFWVNITQSPRLSKKHSQSHMQNSMTKELHTFSLEDQAIPVSSPKSPSVMKSAEDTPKQIRQQIADDINRLRHETNRVIRGKLIKARKEVTQEFEVEFCNMKKLFNSELERIKLGYEGVKSLLSSKTMQINQLEKEIIRKELLIDNFRINKKIFKLKADKNKSSTSSLSSTIEVYQDNKNIKVKLEGTKAYCMHLLDERKKRKMLTQDLEIQFKNIFSENQENKQRLLEALKTKEQKIQSAIDELSKEFEAYREKRAKKIEAKEKEYVIQADQIEKLQRELRNAKRAIKVPAVNYQVLEIKEETMTPIKKFTVQSITKLDKQAFKKKNDKPPLLKRYDDRGDKVFNYRDHAIRMKQIEQIKSKERSRTLSPLSQLKLRTRLNSTDLSMRNVEETLTEL
jgi:hypothetical protein